MKKNNGLNPAERIVRFASVIMAISIIGICFAVARVESIVSKVMIIAVSAFAFLIGAVFMISMAYLKYRETHKHNLFLYDKTTKKDISVQELNFVKIRQGIVEYMAIFRQGKKLYVADLFEDTPFSLEKMKPLICYELLYELLIQNDLQSYSNFLRFGGECSKVFGRYLGEAGDGIFASEIATFFIEFSNDPDTAKKFADFIILKKDDIENKIVSYAKNNINDFVI